MTNLPNAPLIYTIALIRFPMVPNVDRFVPIFHDLVRAEYPCYDEIPLAQAHLNIGPHGMEYKQVDTKVWQFASPDRKQALVLSGDFLAVHTIAYIDHKDFLASVQRAVEQLVSVPDLSLTHVAAIAMRYVDLIVVGEGESLHDVLTPSVLPRPFGEKEGLQIVEGIYVGRYRADGIDVRFQVLRNPPAVLPPDIDTPVIRANQWMFERPALDFAVVDTECGRQYQGLLALDVRTLCDHMYDMRFAAKSIFENIGTPHAQQLWKGPS